MSEIEQNRSNKSEDEPLTLREYVGAFMPPKDSGESEDSSAEAEEERLEPRPFSIRRYLTSLPTLGLTRPARPEDSEGKPLSTLEYIVSLPGAGDLIEKVRDAGRGVQRFIKKDKSNE